MRGLCRRILNEFDYRDTQRLCMHYKKSDGSLVRCGGIDHKSLVRAVCDLYSTDVVEDSWFYGGEYALSESSSGVRPTSNADFVQFEVSSTQDAADVARQVAQQLDITDEAGITDVSRVLVLRTGGPS